jgi:AcrR family transcriptional regulator
VHSGQPWERYRHFTSKAALRDAVTERWLESIPAPLEAVAREDGPAAERLQSWLDLLGRSKRTKAMDDPELFAPYIELAAKAREVVSTHVDTLVAQLTRIISDGVTRGAFEATNPAVAARAVFDATSRFHNPAHAAEWSSPRHRRRLRARPGARSSRLEQRHLRAET